MINTVFYKATDEYNTYEKHIAAPYIRANFRFAAGKKHFLTVSGLGFYDLFINGRKITKGLLAPYISNPDDIVYFDRYDITDLVKRGDNTVALILGNGMQNAPGGRVWDFDIARFRNAPCFAVLHTTVDSKGNEKTEDIGELFKCHPSPVLFDDIRSGCIYDAGREIDGWNLPSFDDSKWQAVKPAERPRGEFRICESDPIRVTEEIKAVEIRKSKLDKRFGNRKNMQLDTEFDLKNRGKEGVLYDFGVNTSGICRLKIDGKKGQRIAIHFCEFITSKGEPSYINTGSFYPEGYSQTVLYICKGKKGETFEPPFCYFGSRCAIVFGLEDKQIKDDALVFLRANSDLKERASFTCSDEIMNKLGAMVRVSDLANFWYFPTDCPHREKNGWTGDAAVSAEHVTLTLTPEKSYREWLRNICKAQDDKGALPGIVPTGGWGFEWGNGPAWDNVLSELCWQIYRLRGDLAPAKECSESLLRYLSYIAENKNEDGLIDFGLGDWLQPERGAGDPIAPVKLTSTVISMYIADKSAALFDALGYNLHRDFALSLASSLKEAVRENLIDFGTMTVKPRCQTSQAICIYYNVFETAEKPLAAKVLREIVADDGDRLDCGMIGLRVIFHVLSDFGYGELAYKMITRTDYPSYGMFVRQGMTSLPEDFRRDEDRDWPNSLNHHFFGDISSWFIQKVAGISVNPRNKSADDFLIRPDFIPALDFAGAHYDAPCGRVSVKWQRKDGEVILTVKAPSKATGNIRLPDGWMLKAEDRNFRSDFLPLKPGKYICEKRRGLK